jgi:methylated-DNA-[protein]-cysteine S-methyltransferase
MFHKKAITPTLKHQEITPFQSRVYEAVKLIPKGKVATYRIIADAIQAKSYRAIGQALRKNPFAPAVPCHRVVKNDLSIGGYKGETEGHAIEEKKALLISEGVKFIGENDIDKSFVVKDIVVNSI